MSKGNELQVVVQQTPGVIQWNFEELKVALQERLAQYTGMVYDDKAITTAKADAAMLRKLRKAVDDRRKEINQKCLEPYKVIEAQAKELTALIDEPISLIDKQVKEYEAEQKRLRREKVHAYMDERFAVLPQAIAEKAKAKVYDTRWENATAKVKDWKAAVDACLADIQRCIGILEGTDEEFREEAMKVYAQDLELSAAIARVQDLEAQKRRVLEAERQRKEREEAERVAREDAARRRVEAEAAQVRKNAAPGQEPPVQQAVREDHNHFVETSDGSTAQGAFLASGNTAPAARQQFHSKQYPPQGWAAKTWPQAMAAPVNDGSITIRLYGTPQEQKKILDYIRFTGVRFERL